MFQKSREFSCKSIYILIGLEETNTAVYTYVVLSLKERSEIDVKGLWVHKKCEFEDFMTNVPELLRKFVQKYISSDRSLRDKHGSIYMQFKT